MTTTYRLMLASLAIVGVIGMSAPAVYAGNHDDARSRWVKYHQEHNNRESKFRGRSMTRKQHGKLRLLDKDLRKDIRSDYKEMTLEERKEYKSEAKQFRTERRESFEAFAGLTWQEVKELLKEGASVRDILTDQGHTEDNTRVYFLNRGNSYVDFLLEHHEIDEESEETLRARVVAHVENLLHRWFSTGDDEEGTNNDSEDDGENEEEDE